MTGIGAISPWGWSDTELWQGLLSGKSHITEPERFDTTGHRTRLAGEVPPAPAAVAAAHDRWRDYSRADRFAVVAAAAAARQAGLVAALPAPRPELGVFFGGSTGGMPEGEEYYRHLTGGGRRARLRLLGSHQLNCPGDAVARLLAAAGPVRSFSSACASGALAIGAALEALRYGEIEAAIAGGADALCQLTYSGFNSLRAVDSKPCRPFRPDRSGLSLGEGAGVLFLETRARAEARGVRPLAELAGAGASCDAHHMTAPHPRGAGAAAAVRRALEDAGLSPAAVDFINAHGTGTPHNDASEWHAIRQVFGDRAPRIPVTSTKGSVGHLLGSSGAIEAVATVQCLAAGEVHPTPGGGSPDEAFDIDLVTGAPRPLSLPDAAAEAAGGICAVSTSFGFGGANAALVFSTVTRSASS